MGRDPKGRFVSIVPPRAVATAHVRDDVLTGDRTIWTALLEPLVESLQETDTIRWPDVDRTGWPIRVHCCASPVGATKTRDACDLPSGVVLPVQLDFGSVVIGPLAGVTGAACPTCATRRRASVDPDHAHALDQRGPIIGGALDPMTAGVVAELAADEIRAGQRGSTGRTRGAYLRVRIADLDVRRHTVLADPLCPRCAEVPGDSASAAILVPTSRPKASRGTFRVGAPENVSDDLLRTLYVDDECGLIPVLRTGDEAGLPVAQADLPMRGTRARDSGWGRDWTYRGARAIAVLEAVERWGGLQAGGRVTRVFATYAELGSDALDPGTLGTHEPDVLASEGFPISAFDPQRPVHWVWAHSFRRGRPVLVPEAYAYYGTHLLRPEEPRFAYEISNGCAVGSCMEEAVLHGLLEVVERDAFLIAWYTRRPLPRIELDTASSRTRLLAAHLESRTGRRLAVYDSTVEHGIPSVWALATHPDLPQGMAASLSAGGAHIDADRAIANALTELGPILQSVDRSYPGQAERVREMVTNPEIVKSMGDHSLLYADPRTLPRLSFLTDGDGGTCRVADLDARSVRPANDLTDDLMAVVDRMLRYDLDVLVVNQTTSEHRATGLTCAKIIVPGAVPMTFGHAARRVRGLPRLLEVPRRLGHRQAPRTVAELNPDPHPFP